jgi:hypothetical protein
MLRSDMAFPALSMINVNRKTRPLGLRKGVFLASAFAHR